MASTTPRPGGGAEGALPEGLDLSNMTVEPPRDAARGRHDMPGAGQAAVTLARRGIARSDPRYYAGVVANAMLGRWGAPPQGFDDADVALLIGGNPFVALSGGVPCADPVRRVREARARAPDLDRIPHWPAVIAGSVVATSSVSASVSASSRAWAALLPKIALKKSKIRSKIPPSVVGFPFAIQSCHCDAIASAPPNCSTSCSVIRPMS